MIIVILMKSTFFITYLVNLLDSMLINIHSNQTLVESKQKLKGAKQGFVDSLKIIFGTNPLTALLPFYNSGKQNLCDLVVSPKYPFVKKLPNINQLKNYQI